MGLAYHTRKLILLGIDKKDKTHYGHFAHELTHIIMHIVYKNKCLPYEEENLERKKLFDEIFTISYTIYKNDPDFEEIMKWCFGAYTNTSYSVQRAELIVRVIHIMAVYQNNKPRIQEVRERYKELFDFFENHVMPDLKTYLEVLTEDFELLTKIKKLSCVLKPSFEKKFTKLDKNIVIKTNSPLLTLLEFRKELISINSSVIQVDSRNLFVDLNAFKDDEKLTKFKNFMKSDQSTTLQRIIIDISKLPKECDERPEIFDLIPKELKYFLVVKVENFSPTTLYNLGFGELDELPTLYSFDDFEENTKEKFLHKNLKFQGNEMKIAQIMKILPHEIFNYFLENDEKVIKVNDGIVECLEKSKLNAFVNRIFLKKVKNERHEKEDKEKCNTRNPTPATPVTSPPSTEVLVEQEGILPYTVNFEYRETDPKEISEKFVILSDFAGTGKTSALKHTSEKIIKQNSTFWVSFVSLRTHSDVFENENFIKNVKKLIKDKRWFRKTIFCGKSSQELEKLNEGVKNIRESMKEELLELKRISIPKEENCESKYLFDRNTQGEKFDELNPGVKKLESKFSVENPGTKYQENKFMEQKFGQENLHSINKEINQEKKKLKGNSREENSGNKNTDETFEETSEIVHASRTISESQNDQLNTPDFREKKPSLSKKVRFQFDEESINQKYLNNIKRKSQEAKFGSKMINKPIAHNPQSEIVCRDFKTFNDNSKRVVLRKKVVQNVEIDPHWVEELLKSPDNEIFPHFVAKHILNLQHPVETSVLHHLYEENKFVILFDGFDEMSPQARKNFLKLCKCFKSRQLWISTQNRLEQEVERKLKTLAYSLRPLTNDEQIDILVKIWKDSSDETSTDKLRAHAEEMIKNFPPLITSDSTKSLGMPLPIVMAAEVYKNENKSKRFKICEVFRKYLKVDESELTKIHHFYALKKIICDQTLLEEILETDEFDFPESQLKTSKILFFDNSSQSYFEHEIFGEFFIADFIGNRLKRISFQPHFYKFLVDVLNNEDFRLVRFFLNDIVQEIESERKLKRCKDNFEVIFERVLKGTILKGSGSEVLGFNRGN